MRKNNDQWPTVAVVVLVETANNFHLQFLQKSEINNKPHVECNCSGKIASIR